MGFVITHIGLLVVLAGALVSYLGADEGTVALYEGEGKGTTSPADPRPAPSSAYDARQEGGRTSWSISYPFRPGALWAWTRAEGSVTNRYLSSA